MDPNATSAASSGSLPKMSDIYSNIQAPSTADLGGSLGDKATTEAGGVSNAFQNYSNYASNLPTASGTYQDLMKQNGIPQLQKTSENLQGNVNNLENSINRVTPNVTANTGNSLVTEAQREGMVNNQTGQLNLQLDPLANSLGQVNSSLATQEANIGNEVNAQNTNQSNLLGVQGAGLNAAESNAALEQAGFSQDESNQLQGLLKKMDITGTLDAAEWATLSTLSENYQTAQQKLQQIQAGQKYQTLGAGDNLVNTSTNQAVNPSMLTAKTGFANGI